ncbi:MAG TPA: hypothetical protein DD706_03335 [Nitrospiraceae bacterium]|nr:hypothetical protein [Nitrospiraceae bacterium]
MNRIEITFPESTIFLTDPLGKDGEQPESLGKRNHRALGTLIDRHIDRFLSRLLGLAKMFVSNETEAEEVVQEMWEQILEDVEQVESRSCLEILLFHILTKRSQTSHGQERVGKFPIHL